MSDDKVFQELGETLFKLNADEKIRYQCEAREEYWRIQNTTKWKLETYEAALAEKDSALAEKDSAIAEKDSALAEKDSALAEKDSAIAELKATIARLQAEMKKEEQS